MEKAAILAIFAIVLSAGTCFAVEDAQKTDRIHAVQGGRSNATTASTNHELSIE